MTEAYRGAIAERLRRTGQDETPAVTLAAAISGVVSHTYIDWAAKGGPGSLVDILEKAFGELAALTSRRVSPSRRSVMKRD
jgi:hypothetical protein